MRDIREKYPKKVSKTVTNNKQSKTYELTLKRYFKPFYPLSIPNELGVKVDYDFWK